MRKEIVLDCIGYFVDVEDRQVIFTLSRPIAFTHNQFTFERPIDINNRGGIWYLSSIESSGRGIVASTIAKALKYCEETFGKDFEDYKGELFLIDASSE
jgi:hypothetical protein